jgi:glutathione S-transferase
MRLYYSPGSCALGIHALMEEIGAPFELAKLDFAEGEQYGEAYRAINPKSKVPALERDDGSVLTEFQAISVYLALTHPEQGLIPADVERHARMMEAMDYVVGTIHATGFRRIFRAAEFSLREADHPAVKARGTAIVNAGFALIDKSLAGKDWIVGDFSLADPALYYVSYWAAARVAMPLPANLRKHYERMMARPAVKKALKDEGL